MIALLATAPALPLHAAGKYVAGAYLVFVALILIYVAIMARRLTRTQRDLDALKRQALELEREREGKPRAAEERELERVS